jgi:hypothetical protein
VSAVLILRNVAIREFTLSIVSIALQELHTMERKIGAKKILGKIHFGDYTAEKSG